jgi:predicted GNAT superfamily acetyltransferase
MPTRTNAVCVRPCRISDVAAVSNLAKSFALPSPESEPPAAGFLVSDYSVEVYADFVKSADFFWVAVQEDEDRLLAFLLAFRSTEDDSTEAVTRAVEQRFEKPFVVIKQIGVSPAAGRSGIATALYRKLTTVVGTDDLFAAIVQKPRNEASESFHSLMGFEPSFPFDGPDGIKRVVWRRTPKVSEHALQVAPVRTRHSPLRA